MTAKERRQYEMLLRLRDFRSSHQDLFTRSPLAQEAFESVNAAINELTATDLVKMSASASARADRKQKARQVLIEVLTKVSLLTRVLRARNQNIPALALPVSRSDQSLLTAARQFARDGAAFEAELAGHGLAPKLITDSAIALEMATSDRGMKQADHTAARARIRELLAAAFLDVRRLDLIIDSELAGNNPVREVWRQIRQVLATRGARGSGATDTTALPSPPTPAPSPEPSSPPVDTVEPEPEAEVVEQLSPAAEAPALATVIEMPLRRVA